MICLYEKTETNFTYNGLGTLEPTECSFFPSINGVWTLKMTLPVDPEGKSNLIENDKIIKVTDIDCIEEQTSDYQLFRIYDFRKEQNYVYVTALPVGLDARFDTFVRSFKLYNKTAAAALSDINNLSNKYTVTGSGYDSTVKSTEFENANIISILNGEDSFVTTWDGEICYDNYNLKVNHRLGTNSTPLDVRYGKNIMGMSYDLDASNVITRLYPKAKSGELLNAIADYKIANEQYVDAENASDYPIPHIYYCEAPYNLVQLSDDGSEEYTASHELYEGIKLLTAAWLRESLTNDSVYDGLLNEIELDWIINNYALTFINDNVIGIAEHIARNIWTNEYHNILSGTVQTLIYNAIKAGWDEVLKNTESEFYLGNATKSWRNNFYSYTWDVNGEFRVRAEEDDVAWIYATSKWHQIGEDGYATGVTDSAKWKWYKKKVNGGTIKRYGNKKKNRYLHSQWWKINDVWYWFNANGEGKKGAWLNNTYNEYFDEAEIDYSGSDHTIYEMLLPPCISGEEDLFELLYRQMTIYCAYLYETDKLAFPTIKLEIDMVDLSRTEEYKDYSFLERIHLGNEVRVYNPRLMPEPSTVRVIGLTYDVLRKCNTEIKIGLTESSVINLLNSIGQSKETKYVAGDGVTIENNVIKVNPPDTPYLEDVLLDGQSVVRNHKAYLDTGELGLGLQWFEEQENTFYGQDTQVDALVENPTFNVDHSVTMHINNVSLYGSKYNYYFKSVNTDSNVIALGYQGAKIATMYSPAVNDDGFLVISKSQSTASIEYWNNNTSHSTYNWSSTTETRQQLVWATCEGYGMSTTFTLEGETYYAVLVCSDVRAVWTKEYEVDGEVGWNSDYGVYGEYDTVADFCKAILEGNITVEKYNGIGREDKLAFFAGAEDEDGTNAQVAIWTDGKVKGLVSDVQKDGDSLVDENGVAHIPNSASSVAELTDVELTNLADKEILEWDAVTEKWKNVANSGGGGGNALILDAQIYSFEERVVGVWTDGKPLYQISFDVGNLTMNNNTWTYFNKTIPNGVAIKGELSNYYRDEATYPIYVTIDGNDDRVGILQSRGMTANFAHAIVTVWYTKTTDRAGSGGYQAYGFSPIIYSEEEREVGVWIDNKPLYAKTIVKNGSYAGNTTLTFSEITSDMNVKKFWGRHTLHVSGTDYTYYFNQNGLAVTNMVYPVDGEQNKYRFYLSSGAVDTTIELTIWYTKTTDTAGSGSYNTLGVPNVHYDDTEKVIGTWFGETLYEKTAVVNLTTPISPRTATAVSCTDFQGIYHVIDYEVVGGYKGAGSDVTGYERFQIRPYDANDAGGKYVTTYDVDTGFTVYTGSNYANWSQYGVDNRICRFYVTARYTKPNT